jgi:hypothetical protein
MPGAPAAGKADRASVITALRHRPGGGTKAAAMPSPSVAPPRPGPIYRLRKQVKRWVAPYPWLYRGLLRLWGLAFGARFLVHAAASGRLRHRRDDAAFAAFLGRQKPLTLDADFGRPRDVDSLRAALVERGLSPAEGGWTFYLPPGPALAAAVPGLAAHYPPKVGLKLLKDLAPPERAKYARHALNPAPGAGLMRKLTPDPKALLRVAAALHAAGLGPKVWDLVHLKSGDVDLTAYVMQHMSGPPSDETGYAAFMARLRRELATGLIATLHPSAAEADDFRGPDCNSNLRLDAGNDRALYVDFQAFIIPDEARYLSAMAAEGREYTHFGGKRFFRGGGAYLYQAIPGLEPGKRDVAQRWDTIRDLLAGGGVSLAGRPVFDIGCNTGLMLYQALGEGAAWASGWDRPAVAAAAGRLLAGLGATRVTLTGVQISDETDFRGALWPHQRQQTVGVLFYLAVSDHIGFPPGVAALPWRYILYEGHADQGVGDQVERLRQVPWLAEAELVGHRMAADGDSPPRPLILLQRDG